MWCLKMNNYFMNGKKMQFNRLTKHILKNSKDFDELVVLCLGEYNEHLSPFLTFASKVGTILKFNHFSVYGDCQNPILIDTESITPILEKIYIEKPNAFVLVVMSSLSKWEKNLGNIYYNSNPFPIKDLKIGNAYLQLCGSYGNGNYKEYDSNGLPLTIINQTAIDISLFLMQLLREKEEKTIENSLKLTKDRT